MNPYSDGGQVYRAEGVVDYFNLLEEYTFGKVALQDVGNFS